MANQEISLPKAAVGKTVIIFKIDGGEGLCKRLRDMGVFEGVEAIIMQSGKSGPCVIRVGEMRLMLGFGMAHKVIVKEK